MNQFVSTFTHRQRLTHDIDLYTFAVSEGSLTYFPGQFVSLFIPLAGSPRPLVRAYSIAGSPDGTHVWGQAVSAPSYQLFIKHLPDGKGTSALKALPIGTTLKTMGPSGHLTIPPEISSQTILTLCASSTGIAPFLSVIEHLAQCSQFVRVYVFWGIRGATDLSLFEKLLTYERLWNERGGSFTIRYCLSREPVHSELFQDIHFVSGRVQQGLDSFKDMWGAPDIYFYLCGAKEFVLDMKSTVATLSPQAHILTERFN